MASVAASFAAALLLAVGAPADFHLMKIREVHPGGASGGSYVVLQMHSGGQNIVAGHDVVVYGPGGAITHTFTFGSSVGNGSNQATILVVGEGYATTFPSGPAADGSDAGLDIPAAGGAVCFENIDCVSWGDFSGSLPSSAGTPAAPAGVTAGKALHRTIEPGCETLLEASDDSNASATDFSEQEPNPRSNASPIVESACVPPDETPPVTTIDNPKPQDGSPGGTVPFFFHADEGGVDFECSLAMGAEANAFSACVSGKTYFGLPDGTHTFKVRGTDEAGNLGAAAVHAWTVDNSAPDTQPPQTFVDTAPPNPSTSSMAIFTYHASEPGSSFECKLDGAAFLACPNVGIAYSGLGNGSHSFQVRARDSSENVDETPAGYTWDVVLTVPPPAPPPDPPPPEEPPPESEPEPGTAVAAGVARVKGAVALLSMRCRGGQGAHCRGALRLIARLRGAGSSRRRVRRLTISRARYSLPAGKSHVIRARLTRQGKGLVRRAGRRGLRVNLVGEGIRNRALMLKPAVRKEKRAKRRPAIARASAFHLIKIREVYAGAGDDSYVVLQMLAADENFVGGHSLRIYDSNGATLHTFTFSPSYVAPNGSHGNNTILVGDTGVQSRFGIEPDDHADGSLDIPAGGGAVCWLSGSPLDCAAWGDFSGHGALPAPGAGSPADPLGIPAEMALRRTIARGCATLLDAADDSDDSAADFSDAFPAPRPNPLPPSERPCSAGGGGSEVPGAGGGAVGAASMQTRIVRGPGRVTRDRSPSFRFRANRRASFRCKQDGRPTRRCRSPFTLRRLSFGCHVFRVSARAGRSIDRTPAVYRFRVVKRRQPGLRQFHPCRPLAAGAASGR